MSRGAAVAAVSLLGDITGVQFVLIGLIAFLVIYGVFRGGDD